MSAGFKTLPLGVAKQLTPEPAWHSLLERVNGMAMRLPARTDRTPDAIDRVETQWLQQQPELERLTSAEKSYLPLLYALLGQNDFNPQVPPPAHPSRSGVLLSEWTRPESVPLSSVHGTSAEGVDLHTLAERLVGTAPTPPSAPADELFPDYLSKGVEFLLPDEISALKPMRETFFPWNAEVTVPEPRLATTRIHENAQAGVRVLGTERQAFSAHVSPDGTASYDVERTEPQTVFQAEPGAFVLIESKSRKQLFEVPADGELVLDNASTPEFGANEALNCMVVDMTPGREGVLDAFSFKPMRVEQAKAEGTLRPAPFPY